MEAGTYKSGGVEGAAFHDSCTGFLDLSWDCIANGKSRGGGGILRKGDGVGESDLEGD